MRLDKEATLIFIVAGSFALIGCEHKHRLAGNTDNTDHVQQPDPKPVDGNMPEVKP